MRGHRQEQSRRYTNLTAAEKITLSSTRFCLSNRVARTFVFFYAIALHVLVFLTLYHFSAVSHRGGGGAGGGGGGVGVGDLVMPVVNHGHDAAGRARGT